MKQIIVLDRDGVINQDSDEYIKSAEEWQPLPGSLEAIAALKQAGWVVAVATNQSGIRQGLYDHRELSRMHQKMQDLLAPLHARVDWVSFSPYGKNDQAWCRKPGPGMLHAIERRFGVSLTNAPLVGDSWRDIEAGLFLHMNPYLVKTGKGERTLAAHFPDIKANAVPVFADLHSVVQHLLK